MNENPLSAWENFYIIVGSSAAALIGLQFVVITLIADRRRLASPAALSAFGTPTVVHLGGALVVSAVMSAPWHSLRSVSEAIGACGFFGIVYGLIVTRRALRQTGYQPVWEDWLWHTIIPALAYLTLTVASFFVAGDSRTAFFVAGAVALSLLLIGIHNAWDTVTYIVMSDVPEKKDSPAEAPPVPASQPLTETRK